MDDENVQSFIERRAETRLSLAIKFRYTVVGSPGAEIQNAVTKNVSAAGLLFENEKQIPIDTELKINLAMPGLPAKAVEVEGKVVRIERLLSSSKFDIGVAFTKVTEKQKEDIRLRIERMNIMKLLDSVRKKEISDLHLTADAPPMVRQYGSIKALSNEVLSEEEVRQMIFSILSDEQRRHFEADKDLDFAFSPSPDVRYRVSIYQQRGKAEVVFRNIIPTIKNRAELGLPDIIDDLCQLKDGIIILAGATGSGKTTTITTMIDIINKKRGGVILSLEKPIEYIHRNIKGIVKQREVGIDVPSFAAGLKASLRQDADIVVVGEVIDPDTIETALQAAETGHLVITSLHATDTLQVFDRIISFFPAEQRDLICNRLSHSLKAVIVQRLLIHKSGVDRVIATEVCMVNTAIKRIIASRDFSQLRSVMQTGSQYKMHLMEDSIDKLFERDLITAETYEMFHKAK